LTANLIENAQNLCEYLWHPTVQKSSLMGGPYDNLLARCRVYIIRIAETANHARNWERKGSNMKLGLKDLEHSLFAHGRPGRKKMEDWSHRGTAAEVSLQSNEFSGARIQPDSDPDYSQTWLQGYWL
jgi:hypothetical protein